ncbi:MAG: hypothetical protein GXO74_00030 [Calditrichaeota bacterium]|nr:hypothetical protein [Calditrichota bacterium]
MNNFAYSINNIPIRLTTERWTHVVENHDEMAGHYFDVLEAIANPDMIVQGNEGELWAVRFVSKRKTLLVIYREIKENSDGFVITAFFTSKIEKLLKRKILWKPQ